ncbi:MFS transporter, PAT family, beta-lactamase induction signal transducer AmpG [Acinetobacter marinus]|uniref:MFS transporter, PAT family, beta-lactamase induction signal transducer AmpG n=1 Tax=Acinetobacter marinus TaxID=281375 RepID=A0A1G6GU72_9GAMM|nr:MFS transporter [Acinetobacter marinus]SDB84676.1 MFS transporter, PAT family, beta-lactamase induction signal transducer AmpG [Acinetobacter marinus]
MANANQAETNEKIQKNWGSAFHAFLDRRAIIMLFLGFSAGIPILLIFSSLSLWLGEAGIEKSAVTMFSWAALGYSFKFVWAPLIDEIPVPFLTKTLGRRRAWLLIAQCLIMVAIFIMAMSNPAMGSSQLIQMAIGAVLLGFASATQDIVIDAYRIELAPTEMQTVLASTYNAGYRIGMIIAGAGALFIAAAYGTAKGNYIYEAWQKTYWIMAAVMIIGVITTLTVGEPKVERVYKSYKKSDYLRLVFVFFCAVIGLVIGFIYIGKALAMITVDDPFLSFLLAAIRFIGSFLIAFTIGYFLVQLGAVNRQMAKETWVAPFADFFKRYGLKLALVLLLLIGFFRISDIVAGVISNVFYQDMNFSKEQIAEAVKIYGVIFTLIGGFLGGLLSQRFNIMKVMFIGAILASSTNLIFIALVKSGAPTSQVSVDVAGQHYTANTDEVGFWKVAIPTAVLAQDRQIVTKVAYQNGDDSKQGVQVERAMPYLVSDSQAIASKVMDSKATDSTYADALNRVQIQLLPLTRDGYLEVKERDQSVVVEGQVLGLTTDEIAQNNVVQIQLDGESFDANVDQHGNFTVAIPSDTLAKASAKSLMATYQLNADQQFKTQKGYEVQDSTLTFDPAKDYQLNNLIDPLPMIDDSQATQVVSGKVVKEYSKFWLYMAIVMDNLASGLAGAAFIAFLSSLTSVSFTAVQYAIFSSLMTLTPKIIGGYSGTIVTNIGYPNFFLMTTLIGIPILILVVWVAKLLKAHERQQTENSH